MNISKISSPLLKRFMSNSVTKKLDFYYDVISPYSWFAFEVLHRYKKHWDFDLNLCPLLLGGIFKETDNVAPMTVPAKAKYLQGDVRRSRKYFDVPISHLNEPFELIAIGSLIPMKFLTALKMNFPHHLEDASRAFWMIRWHKDEDFTTPEALKEVYRECKLSDKEAKLILDKMNSDEVKAAIKKQCKDAAALDLFGVPTTVIHNENGEQVMIFGSDRFPFIAYELGEEWKGPHPDKKSQL